MFTKPHRRIAADTATRWTHLARSICVALPVAIVAAVLLPACNLINIPGFGGITASQQFALPNFTVEFSIAGAVTPSTVSSVNWTFGDGPGFTTGGVTISHRYNSAGTYNVSAFVFFNNGLPNRTINGSVTVVVPNAASNPSPANNASDVFVNTVLGWFGGNSATSHDVYLGTDETAVTNATRASPEFRGTVTNLTFNPGGLIGGTVYFWRIDAIRASGTTKGTVWTFATINPPGQASNPRPADAATDVAPTTQLAWTAGNGASSHDVYFGTDQTAVTNATRSSPEFRGNQPDTTFNPGVLLNATTYFWRVDEVGNGGTTIGTVLSFSVAALPTKATNPDPPDNATDVDVATALSWTPGSDATSHDVYFGTNQNAVASATTQSAAFVGNQADPTTQPAGVQPNTTYFWRIDERGPGGVTKGDVWKFETANLPGEVTQPMPASGAAGVDVNPTLSWTAGALTNSFDVYFGTSSTAVNNATAGSPEFQGNQGDPMFMPAGPLNTNTTHFWRVDSVGPGGTTKGPLWSFTTVNPEAASNPSPADEATDVALAVVLGWSPGAGATMHDVYLGTDESAVTNANTFSPEFQGTFPGLSFDPPGDLTPGTTYFWRIDEHVGMNVVKGLIWRFTTILTPPDPATTPSPADGATDVALSTSLSWAAGARATSHDVYFGTDQTAVTNATTASPEFRGNRPTTTFNPGPLTAATTYFWRIDEKNAAGTTTGSVFSFTTIPNAPAKATSPSPANAAAGQNVNTAGYDEIDLTLSWAAGAGATSHDVYFGTDQTAVTNATTATGSIFRGNQSGTTFDPGVLAVNTTYFWRIDEKNAGGTTKGDVWSFTTATAAPGQATAPNPANFNSAGTTMPTLMWTAGANTTSHDVYFGTTQTSVNNATRSSAEFAGNQAGTSYAPGTLAAGSTFFWRIDEIGPGGVTKGVVWQFTTPP